MVEKTNQKKTNEPGTGFVPKPTENRPARNPLVSQSVIFDSYGKPNNTFDSQFQPQSFNSNQGTSNNPTSID